MTTHADRRPGLRLVRLLTATLVTASLAALAGCTATTAEPEAAGRTAAPVSRQEFACPTAGSLAGLTALPFSLEAGATTCAYTADDAGKQATVTVRHPVGRTTTLQAARAAVRSGTTSDAADLGYGAFTVRGADGSCSVLAYAADGVVTRVVARHGGWTAARACGLARSVVTLMGTAAPPVVSAITAATLPSTSSGGAAWTTRVADGLKVRVRALDAGGSGYLDGSGTTSLLGRAGAVDAGSTAVVLVSGTGDAGSATLDVLQAATKALAAARAKAPRARLIVVGPVRAGATPSARVLALRDDLHRAASIAGASFIDPIGNGWGASAAATSKRLASAVERTLRSGSICPAVTSAVAAPGACDAAKDVSGAPAASPAPVWTPGTT